MKLEVYLKTVLLRLGVMPKMKSEIPWHLCAYQTVWSEQFASRDST